MALERGGETPRWFPCTNRNFHALIHQEFDLSYPTLGGRLDRSPAAHYTAVDVSRETSTAK